MSLHYTQSAQSIRYFSRRLLNPFRGVAQFIEVGGTQAVTHDGLTWQLYGDDGYGWVRPIGIWETGRGAELPAALHRVLHEALRSPPPLPFPADDGWECWLLDRDGAPLALIASAAERGVTPENPLWWPFVERYTGFVSPALRAAGVAEEKHAAWLMEAVDKRAGPQPFVGWFDGRQESPLLAEGNNLLEQSAIRDYHAHIAPLLLAWSGLTAVERADLERAAFQNPVACDRAYRLWPQVQDAQGLQTIRVAAQLMR